MTEPNHMLPDLVDLEEFGYTGMGLAHVVRIREKDRWRVDLRDTTTMREIPNARVIGSVRPIVHNPPAARSFAVYALLGDNPKDAVAWWLPWLSFGLTARGDNVVLSLSDAHELVVDTSGNMTLTLKGRATIDAPAVDLASGPRAAVARVGDAIALDLATADPASFGAWVAAVSTALSISAPAAAPGTITTGSGKVNSG